MADDQLQPDVEPDTPASVPDPGHTDAVPEERPDAASIIEEEVGKDEATPSGKEKGDEEPAVDVPGADDTVVRDPLLEALSQDERFKGHTYKTGKEALDGFAEARGAVGRVDYERRIGREVSSDWDAFQEFRKEQASKADPVEEQRPVFDPPPMPSGIVEEMQKPVAERDVQKIDAFNKRVGYMSDKWRGWMEDPNTLLGDLVGPFVDDLIAERLHQQGEAVKIRSVVEAEKDFIDGHFEEVQALRKANPNTSLETLLELAKLRHNAKGPKAEKAKETDTAELEADAPGPQGVAHPEKIGKEDEGPPDGASIMRDEMRRRGMPVN